MAQILIQNDQNGWFLKTLWSKILNVLAVAISIIIGASKYLEGNICFAEKDLVLPKKQFWKIAVSTMNFKLGITTTCLFYSSETCSHLLNTILDWAATSWYYVAATFLTEWFDLKPESFLQNLWATDGQTQFVCTQRNEHFFASVIFTIGAHFLFWLFSRAMLHFKHQVSPTCTEVDLRLAFHWWGNRAQYIDTLLWFNVVFAYHDHDSRSHTLTLSLSSSKVI